MRGYQVSSVSRHGPLCGLLVGGLLVIVGLTACGSGDKDALKMRLGELEDRMNQLSSHGDMIEGRVAALENHQTARQAQGARAQSTDAPPPLEVVKLAPTGEPRRSGGSSESSTSEAASSEEPRPVIQGSGDRVETRLPTGSSRSTGAESRPITKTTKGPAPKNDGSGGGRPSPAGGKMSIEPTTPRAMTP